MNPFGGFSADAGPIEDRPLGTMVTYGYPEIELDDELSLAIADRSLVAGDLARLGPLARSGCVRKRAGDRGLSIHSAHGCWGGRTIRARRVDLGSLDASTHRESIDDLKACIDWLAEAGGKCLVVHPGGLSDPEECTGRRLALSRGLWQLAEHARGTGVIVCVENMPPGVYPGSRMAELAELLRSSITLNLALRSTPDMPTSPRPPRRRHGPPARCWRRPMFMTIMAARILMSPRAMARSTGGTWGQALDSIGYGGPILLECIRHLRHSPASLKPEVLAGPLRTCTIASCRALTDCKEDERRNSVAITGAVDRLAMEPPLGCRYNASRCAELTCDGDRRNRRRAGNAMSAVPR